MGSKRRDVWYSSFLFFFKTFHFVDSFILQYFFRQRNGTKGGTFIFQVSLFDSVHHLLLKRKKKKKKKNVIVMWLELKVISFFFCSLREAFGCVNPPSLGKMGVHSKPPFF